MISNKFFAVIFFFLAMMLVQTATATPSQWLAPCPDGNGQCLWYPCRDGNGAGECTDAQPVTAAPAVVRQPVATQPAPAPAPSTANTATTAPSASTNWWPLIVGLGIIALTVVGVLYFRRLARIAREVDAALRAQERRRVRERIENELVAAQIAYDRNGSRRDEDRLMRAQIALHRHDHAEPAVGDGRVDIVVAPGHGEVLGAPFMGGPFVIRPAAPAPAPAP